MSTCNQFVAELDMLFNDLNLLKLPSFSRGPSCYKRVFHVHQTTVVCVGDLGNDKEQISVYTLPDYQLQMECVVPCQSIAVSQDASFIAAQSHYYGHVIRLLDVRARTVTARTATEECIYGFNISLDGSKVVACGPQFLTTWLLGADQLTPRPHRVALDPKQSPLAAFNPSCSLVVITDPQSFCVIETVDCTMKWRLEVRVESSTLAFSPTGRYVALGEWGCRIIMIDLHTSQTMWIDSASRYEAQSEDTENYILKGMVFSPDDQFVSCASVDPSCDIASHLHVWSVQDGRHLLDVQQAHSLAFL